MTQELCPLCRRAVNLTAHHLIPRKVQRRAHFKKHFSKEQLNETVMICRECHNGIHRLYDEMTLAKRFASLKLLSDDETLARHFNWVARQRRTV